MKNIILIAAFLFNGYSSLSQDRYQVVSLLSSQEFELNGGFRGSIGGQSRKSFKIDLPDNTVRWYYTVTTRSVPIDSNLKLATQLAMAVSSYGASASMIDQIEVPSGNSKVDVVMFAPKDYSYFEDKYEISKYIEGSRDNYIQGTVEIDDVKTGTIYLGFVNPSTSYAVHVIVEAAAIVDSNLPSNGWTIEQYEQVVSNLKNYIETLEVSTDYSSEIALCSISKLAKDYTAASIQNMNTEIIDEKIISYSEECLATLYPQTEVNPQAMTYGNMGWSSFQNNDIQKAISYSEKALAIQPDLAIVQANLGLFYLIQNNEEKAISYYAKAIENFKKDHILGKQYLQETIIDIKKAKADNKFSNNIDHVIEMLQSIEI